MKTAKVVAGVVFVIFTACIAVQLAFEASWLMLFPKESLINALFFFLIALFFSLLATTETRSFLHRSDRSPCFPYYLEIYPIKLDDVPRLACFADVEKRYPTVKRS